MKLLATFFFLCISLLRPDAALAQVAPYRAGEWEKILEAAAAMAI
jgi:hypothetical protein